MPSDSRADVKFEIGRVLFIDIVGYSKLLINYLGLGEKEKALDWLEKSYQDQESACWYLKVDPIYDSVRNEPSFQALVQKVFHEVP